MFEEESTLIVSNANLRTLFILSFKDGKLFFLTIDDCFYLFIICSIIRSLAKKSTIGILIQPLAFLKEKKLKNIIKLFLLKKLKDINLINVLNIYPGLKLNKKDDFYSGEIYDPAFWDLEGKDISTVRVDDDLNYIFKKENIYILYIGSITLRKRFDLFIECCRQNKNKDTIKFIAAGDSADSFDKEMISEYLKSGGILFDRYITDEEVIYLQSNSDVYWAFYSENFDQSSGIAGRAYQLNKKLITRNGSLINSILANLNFTTISIQENDVSSLFQSNSILKLIEEIEMPKKRDCSLKFKSISQIKNL